MENGKIIPESVREPIIFPPGCETFVFYSTTHIAGNSAPVKVTRMFNDRNGNCRTLLILRKCCWLLRGEWRAGFQFQIWLRAVILVTGSLWRDMTNDGCPAAKLHINAKVLPSHVVVQEVYNPKAIRNYGGMVDETHYGKLLILIGQFLLPRQSPIKTLEHCGEEFEMNHPLCLLIDCSAYWKGKGHSK